MDGGFFLIHRVDVQMGDAQVKAIEMIGPYDSSTQRYPMRSFDNDGHFATMHAHRDADGTLHLVATANQWARDGNSAPAGKWQHWMDLHFTRT